jgi:hypothetical protein
MLTGVVASVLKPLVEIVKRDWKRSPALGTPANLATTSLSCSIEFQHYKPLEQRKQRRTTGATMAGLNP